MCQNPPPQSRPAEWPVAGVKRTKINNFSHSAPPAGPGSAESRSPKLWHSLRQPTSQAYSQSRLVLPSKRPARNNNVWVIGDAATAKRMICQNTAGLTIRPSGEFERKSF
jgi:hypothetical protein